MAKTKRRNAKRTSGRTSATPEPRSSLPPPTLIIDLPGQELEGGIFAVKKEDMLVL